MSEVTQHPSICRFCTTGCPVVVDIQDGRIIKVAGNKQSPTYYGFCCTRGQAVPEQIHHPERLFESQARQSDGTYAPIASEKAMDEIAEKLRAIIAEHGPDSVACYMGTYSTNVPSAIPFLMSFMHGIGSSSAYTSNTIDQPGKDVAASLIGGWEAGPHSFGESDVWMILGGNGLVSIAVSLPGQNPGRRLTNNLNRGMKLVVIDPRKTETARRAHVHLQPRPGEDATILAGMIRYAIKEDRYDRQFVEENVSGFEALKDAVEPFTPDYVARRADIPEADFLEAARLYTEGPRGLAVGATGVNMSGRSSLNEFLILALNTICGRFIREGDPITNPGVLLPRALPKAQARPPRPARNLGPELSVRGLAPSAAGMPTAALADEILNGKIKALINVGGNPVAAIPDQERIISAINSLDFCVQIDIKMSATAKIADYVIAPKIGFEVPTASYQKESMELFSSVGGAPEPFGMYAPTLIDTPEGSDLIEEWELFYGLARRMGLELTIHFPNRSAGSNRELRPAQKVDMENKPTSDEILAMIVNGSRIPLEEVKKHPNGALFPEDIRAAPKDADCTSRLHVGDEGILTELREMLDEPVIAEREGSAFPFMMVSRRMAHVYNSSGRDMPMLQRKGGSYNPAFMNPEDMQGLGIDGGEEVTLTSPHGAIRAIAEEDQTVRKGVVSISHAYGDLPSSNEGVRQVGSNTNILISVEDDYDKISGIPRMSGVPIRVDKVA